MTEDRHVSSPLASGGAGSTFQQHVGAMLLALLLVRGVPAVFKGCQVDAVGFQTRHFGWETDDLLVRCSRGTHEEHLLAMQVKRDFAVRLSSLDCVETFQRFWKDFKAVDRFHPDSDALVLVTLPSTKILMSGLGSLLECARNSSDESDFAHRLSVPGFVSNNAQKHKQIIRAIIDQVDSSIITDEDFWRFLKSIYLWILDFTTSTAQHEAWVRGTLAQAAADSDALSAAESTWHELIDLAGTSASGARTLSRSDLPESMRARHNAIESPVTDLQILREHSDVVLQGIQSTIAKAVTLSRNQILAQANQSLAEIQVVALTGPPGSGKSALAKAIVQVQTDDHVCLSFRAEEFAQSHIDRVLPNLITGQRLEAALGAQERVLVHVESLERLLEHPTRDAFTDLIRIVKRHQNVRLLLTCRNYSLATALASFFDQSTLAREVIEVPPLSDIEINEAVASLPQLTLPLSNPKLKHLLRVPYFLDMAARMDWTSEHDMPSDVQAFRWMCWDEVVRRNGLTMAGLPDKRERALIDLAVRRARDLLPMVSVEEIDADALDALWKDGIIFKDADRLAAPAHDVMEDWAIIRWMETLMAKHQWQAPSVAEAVGGHPALRRGFREWLKEVLDRDNDMADQFVFSTCSEHSVPQYFRDDVLISALLSSSARDFVARQRDQLLADDASLLVRLIHLTRVACKDVPRWLGVLNAPPSVLLVPEGEAWPAVLEAVADGLDDLLPAHMGLIVGLLEDWSRGATSDLPLPDGATPASTIAYRLLEDLGGYGDDDSRERVLRAIARVPKFNERGFIDLADRAMERVGRRDPVLRDFAEILLYGIDGGLVCRDFPEQMARLTRSWCCLTDDDLKRIKGHYESSISIEPAFGLPSYLDLKFFPASAIRGPFLPLLRHHPAVGVQLVLDLVNHAGAWYGERKWPAAHLEPAQPITISIPNYGEVKQWANDRLWAAYRGTHVTPELLNCALMALETWLLELCDRTDDVERWLLRILRESNNVMTTAVVASVCNAHPWHGGSAALALLTSREAVEMDRVRMSREPDAIPLAAFPRSDPMGHFYDQERQHSNERGHRHHDIEALAWKLQVGGQRGQVWQIIDAHRAGIPDEDARTDEDRAWFLALHRMDIRNYEAEVATPTLEDGKPKIGSDEGSTILLKSKEIDADVREFVDRGSGERWQFETSISLLDWGMQQWTSGPEQSNREPWWVVLARARDIHGSERLEGPMGFANSGPGIVAAVCVRNHWEDLGADDRRWCLDTLMAEVERDSDDHTLVIQVTNNPMNADRYGAYVLPMLLAQHPGDTTILKAIGRALTHPSTQVSLWAAEGVSEYLGSEHNDVMMACAGVIAMQANLFEKHQNQGNRDDNQQLSISSSAAQRVRDQVRETFVAGAINAEEEIAALDLTSWQGRFVAARLLAILRTVPDLALSQDFFVRAAQALATSWASKRQPWNGGRDYSFENDVIDRLANIALTLPSDAALFLCKPFLDAVGRYPGEVETFVETLISREDTRSSHMTCFWDIWQAFADRILDAPWLPWLDSYHSSEMELVGKMLLGVPWKDGIRQWHRLDGHEYQIDEFVTGLPAISPIVAAYARYLYEVGEGSLPDAFLIVEDRLLAGDPSELLSGGSTVFYLESLLRRYVYGQPLRLKSNSMLQDAVLKILDQLVDAGSSAAYRMRDDFVTPRPHTT